MPAALTGIAVTGSVLVCPGLGGSILDWELRYQWPVSAASCSRRPGIFEAGNCAMRPGGLRKAKDRPVMTVAEKAPVGIEPTNGGFADLCLTTWLRRRKGPLSYSPVWPTSRPEIGSDSALAGPPIWATIRATNSGDQGAGQHSGGSASTGIRVPLSRG